MNPLLLVVGARPNFMKMAPLYEELKSRNLPVLLLHTGQHYDDNMSKLFFDEFGMPEPDFYLGVGSVSHAEQTARIMLGFEKVCIEKKPSMVIVAGDVNYTIACALVAAKLWIPVAHVEAGLRSFDRRMPEEINRILTDSISDLLFTPSKDADGNLIAEGIDPEKIKLVGNIMIDTLLLYSQKAGQSNIHRELQIQKENYALITLHRPSNVDFEDVFLGIIDALESITKDITVVFPVHPRTKKRIEEFGLTGIIKKNTNFVLTGPLGYLDFLALTKEAKAVLTDSGGLQEETTALGVPCITIRENTERPITVEQGTNLVVGNNKESILKTWEDIARSGGKRGKIPELWDGNTAKRIGDIIEQFFVKGHKKGQR